MTKKILDFIGRHRVCSLTTLLPDGSPHAAALHYSHSEKPFTLFFMTPNTTKKSQALLKGRTGSASVVIGFSEEEWLTMQLDGQVQMVTDKAKLKKIHKIHFAKHPNAEKYKNDPATIFLEFTPKWWRFSDYNVRPVKTVEST